MSQVQVRYVHYAVVTYLHKSEYKTRLIDFINDYPIQGQLNEDEIMKRVGELFRDFDIEIITKCTIR